MRGREREGVGTLVAGVGGGEDGGDFMLEWIFDRHMGGERKMQGGAAGGEVIGSRSRRREEGGGRLWEYM